MINHMDIKVHDLKKTKQFYQPLLSVIGYSSALDNKNVLSFTDKISSDPCGDLYFSIGIPTKHHFAFQAANHEQVRAFYETAIALGAVANGAPGIRPDYHSKYFACYVIDLDGYPIECVCHE